MALLDDVRSALRVSSGLFDSEVQTLIDTALFDMQNKGVSAKFIGSDSAEYPAIVRQAIVLYAKSHFGYDNDEAERFQRAYDSIVCSLINGSQNVESFDG